MTDHTPLTVQQLTEIEARAARLYERTASIDPNAHPDFGQLTDADVPALLAEIRRLRAELRIGSPWTCHVCGKENHRDVCLICETDRPDPAEPAAP